MKVARDREGYPLSSLYPQQGPKEVGHHRIRMLGRPDMSSVKYIMIGIRNEKTPDGRPYNVSLWADELRVTDFDRTAGWAANMNLTAKIADLGNVSANLKHIGFGYGSVQSRISERSRGETNSYGVTAQLNLDKLLPPKAGLVIPMYASYNRLFTDPNFDPANPDVRISAVLKSFSNDQERSDYKKLIRDETAQHSLNFTNVRKIKTNKDSPSRIYDVENFSFTYAFSESKQTNFNLLENTIRNTSGNVTWQYNPSFEGIEPFKNSKGLKSPFLKWLKEFNFNPVPSSMMVRGDVQRAFTKIAYRNTGSDMSNMLPNYQKYIVFNRTYNMRWGLTKALTMDYNAVANAIIDEPEGDIDTQKKKDSILNNFKRLGRMKAFNQRITFNYSLPFSKFPVTDWVGTDVKYEAEYNWKAGPYELTDTLRLGNVISNSRTAGATGQFNLVALYNKVKLFKEINAPPPANKKKKDDKKPDGKTPKVEETRGANNFLLKKMIRLLLSVRNVTFSYDLTESTILPGFTPTPSRFGLDHQWRSPGVGFVFGEQDHLFAQKAAHRGWLTHNPRLTLPFTQNQKKEFSAKMKLEPMADLTVMLDWRKSTNAGFQEIFRYSPDSKQFGAVSPNRTGSYTISYLPARTAFKNNASLHSDVFQTFKENIGVIQKRFRGATGNEYQGKAQDVLIPAFIAAYSGKSADNISLVSFPKIPLPNWRLDYSGLSKIEALKSIFQSISLSHGYTASYTASNYTNSMQYADPSYLDVASSVEDYNRLGYATIKDQEGNIVPIFVIGQVLISEKFAPLAGLTFRTAGNLDFRVEYTTRRDVTLNVSNAQVSELNSNDWSVTMGYIKNNLKLPFRDQGRVITLKNEVAFRMNMSMSNMRVIQRKIEDESLITNGQVNFQLRPNVTYTISKTTNVQAYVERTVYNPLVSNSFRRTTTRVGFKITVSLSQ
ncbi:MAG: cell surface protein SprA [Candidatus Nephrothrix sp. EaCA]|nr:MAG: cell surface protein SprA [Candidatus Nephrothrix sp. EaCA]